MILIPDGLRSHTSVTWATEPEAGNLKTLKCDEYSRFLKDLRNLKSHNLISSGEQGSFLKVPYTTAVYNNI